MPEEPTKLESENIFDPDLLDVPKPEEPLVAAFTEMMSPVLKASMEMMRPGAFEPPKCEYKVRIFQFNDRMIRGEVCTEIEAFLNDGWDRHQFPVVCGDYVMLTFSRRKEDKDNG